MNLKRNCGLTYGRPLRLPHLKLLDPIDDGFELRYERSRRFRDLGGIRAMNQSASRKSARPGGNEAQDASAAAAASRGKSLNEKTLIYLPGTSGLLTENLNALPEGFYCDACEIKVFAVVVVGPPPGEREIKVRVRLTARRNFNIRGRAQMRCRVYRARGAKTRLNFFLFRPVRGPGERKEGRR